MDFLGRPCLSLKLHVCITINGLVIRNGNNLDCLIKYLKSYCLFSRVRNDFSGFKSKHETTEILKYIETFYQKMCLKTSRTANSESVKE